jgi:general secretion pathway protein G
MRGFTLIELLITLSVLAILATMTVPVAELAMQRAKENELKSALREIRNGIDAYKRATMEGNIKRELGTSGYPKSLNDLVDGVKDVKDPEHNMMYFLRRLPRDPMNNDESISPADTWAKRSYASTPTEPREGDDVFDIYSPSTQVGLNGVPYKEW